MLYINLEYSCREDIHFTSLPEAGKGENNSYSKSRREKTLMRQDRSTQPAGFIFYLLSILLKTFVVLLLILPFILLFV